MKDLAYQQIPIHDTTILRNFLPVSPLSRSNPQPMVNFIYNTFMIPSSATPYFTPHNLYLLIYVCITIHSKLKLMAELPFTPPNSAKFKIIFTYFPLDPSTQSSLLSYFLHSKVSKKCVPSSHPFRFESCNTAYNETTIQTQNPFHQYFYNNLRTFTNAKLI